MDVLRFENQSFLYLFSLLPVLFLLIWFSLHKNKKNLRKLGQWKLINRMIPYYSFRRPWIKFTLYVLAFSSLIIAAANPQIGFGTKEVTRQGVELVVALDVSRSMLAEDIRPNRMERAKMAVSRLIDKLENDRLAVVLFAGNAITQVPLTNDYDAAKMLLRTVNTNSVQIQGTNFVEALKRSISSFGSDETSSRVIIMITDGENHEDDPLPIVRKATEKGIIVHTVGIGTSKGAPIPVYQNNRLSGYLQDAQGNTIISRFDEATLRAIATEGNGIFQTGTGADMGLDNILEEIRKLEQQEYETKQFAEYESRFHYFLALAIIFLLLEVLIFERKNKWLNKIKLFDIS